ncbi:MAG: membrane dipeptidase [Saprospiraceae bacterium]
MQTRKQFLKNTLSIASGVALYGLKGMPPLMTTPPYPYVSFDLHCHPGRLFEVGNNFGAPLVPGQTIHEMISAHISGAFFSLVADSKLIKLGPTGVIIAGKYESGEAWSEYKRQLKDMKDFLEKSSVHQSTKSSDLKPSGPLAAYISVEGGDFLEGQVDRLDEVYQDGVRSIQLVHYAPNDLGDLQTSTSMHNGLSSFGKDVVRKMNKLGILIDVAHATLQTTKAVAGLSDAPIMLSHSILEMDSDRPIAKRAISKEHAQLVAKTGGLIGAWPSGFNKSFEEYVDNILRMADVVGIDHVGIGTDMDGNFKPVLSSYIQFSTLANAFKNKGLSVSDIGKIMGDNASRVLKKVFKTN